METTGEKGDEKEDRQHSKEKREAICIMKKAITMFLAAVLCVSMSISAMAADSVTIQQAYDGMRDVFTIQGIRNTSTVTVGDDYSSRIILLRKDDTKTVYEVPVGQPVVLHDVELIEICKAEIRDGKVYTDGSDTGISGLFDDLTARQEEFNMEYTVDLYSGPLNITVPGYYVLSAYVGGSAQAPNMDEVTSILHVVEDGAQPEQPADDTDFADVSADAYYAAPVDWAVAEGITDGTSDTTFSPDKTCTRAEIITFLWRAAGSPEPADPLSFPDVNTNMYYAKAVAWAAENGMANGDIFSPDAPCTREMAVEFMWKHAGSPEAAEAGFSDISSGSVDWAVENGVTDGTSDTTFSPKDTCTRAQIVTFLYRAFAK